MLRIQFLSFLQVCRELIRDLMKYFPLLLLAVKTSVWFFFFLNLFIFFNDTRSSNALSFICSSQLLTFDPGNTFIN